MMNSLRSYRFFLALLVLLMSIGSLPACGFHLRGFEQNHFVASMQKFYLDTPQPYSDFNQTLKQRLREAGAILVSTAKEANIILQIPSVSFTHNSLNLLNDNYSGTVQYVYMITVSATKADGSVLLPLQPLQITRSVNASNSQLITNRDAPLLQESMKNDLIFQLMSQLTAADINHESTKTH